MVLDTRKTTPGLRALEKYAVRCGGGTNKRMGLYDVAMIKDNHKLAAGWADRGVRRGAAHLPRGRRSRSRSTTTAEALESVAAGARFLLCDNMSTDLLRTTVDAVRGTGESVEIEATGNLTLEVAARLRRDRGRLPVGRWADPLLARSSTSRSTSTPTATEATPARASVRRVPGSAPDGEGVGQRPARGAHESVGQGGRGGRDLREAEGDAAGAVRARGGRPEGVLVPTVRGACPPFPTIAKTVPAPAE